MSLERIQHMLIDMDGVLWRGDTPQPGLTEFFATLRQREVSFLMLTNNSTRVLSDYVEKFGRFDIAITTEQVLTSAYATANWLKERLPRGAPVFVVGESGLHTELAAAGFAVTFEEPLDSVDAVAVGLYMSIDYMTIHHAARLVRQGALFVGTNPDATFPYSGGLGPGAGTILAAIGTAAGRKPTVIGKPNQLMFHQALDRLGAAPEATAMLGDRLDTDILGGQRAGLHTILVMSGVTTSEDLEAQDLQPTWVFDDIVAVTHALSGRD